MSDRLYSVEGGSSARAVAGLLRVLFPDAQTVLDASYGSGRFWRGSSADVTVTGLDRDPARAPHVVGDFRALPFADGAFDVVIFDPPYQWDMGRGKPSIMGARFATYGSEAEARSAVQQGSREAWRVARLGVLVKVQNHIHASKLAHMTRWVEDAIPSPLYDELHVQRPAKLLDPKWGDQLSVYRTHATFLAFRRGDQRHVRRSRPAERTA